MIGGSTVPCGLIPDLAGGQRWSWSTVDGIRLDAGKMPWCESDSEPGRGSRSACVAEGPLVNSG